MTRPARSAGGIEAPTSCLPRKNGRRAGLLAGLAVLGLAALVSLVTGSRPVSLETVYQALMAYDRQNDQHLVIWALRIPRTLLAILAGLSLGIAGAIMQAITRNPLAEPGLLGVNAGAAVAVVFGVSIFGMTAMSHYVWFGFGGAGLAGIAVFILGQAHEATTNPVRIVLAGVGLSVMLGSITGIVILNAPTTVLDQFRNWSAGSVDGRGFEVVGVLAVAAAAGLATAMAIAGNLNAIALGEDLGRALGVNMRLTLGFACLCVMLLAGAATAAAGPIGFVGLIAPHLARSIAGSDYRWILPFSALFAAILLLCADILGRVVASPDEVAAGIIATLIGGPFFLVIVRRFRLRQL